MIPKKRQARIGDREREERTAMTRQRSHVYGFLAAVYRQEITADLLGQIKDPRFLGVFSDLGVDLSSDFFKKSEKALLDDLAVEYARLFLGPGRHISPHESVHHIKPDEQDSQLWGKTTVEVKKFIESTGLQYRSEYRGLPDHISVELEFMEHMILQEARAWGEEDRDGVLDCLNMEKAFMDQHLICWIPGFCEKIIREAEIPFYGEMAALTNNFIEFEKEALESYGIGFNRPH